MNNKQPENPANFNYSAGNAINAYLNSVSASGKDGSYEPIALKYAQQHHSMTRRPQGSTQSCETESERKVVELRKKLSQFSMGNEASEQRANSRLSKNEST